MIYGPDRLIYVGSIPPYGELGGAMAVWDPKQNKVIENYRDLVKNQSIVALAYEPPSGLIFGGSGNYGGGGTNPARRRPSSSPSIRARSRRSSRRCWSPARSGTRPCGGRRPSAVRRGLHLLRLRPANAWFTGPRFLAVSLEISLGLHRTAAFTGFAREAFIR